VEPGAVVPVGAVLAYVLEEGEELAAPVGEEGVSALPQHSKRPTGRAEIRRAERGERVFASPIARRVAKEKGIDLALVEGTGPRGRITERDVRSFAESTPLPAAERADTGSPVTEPPEEDVEWLDLTTVQRVTAERMVLSRKTIPHFTLTVEADMSELARVRDRLNERVLSQTGSRLSYTVLLVRIVALAIRRHPLLNAEFADQRIKVHKQVNIGVAVGTPDGLFVPVIRQADRKDLLEIARELARFRQRAAAIDFSPDDLSGGTFTLTNLGMFDVDTFIPIINPPQSAILGVGRIADRPARGENGAVELVPMANLTLAADHRVLDGFKGAQFLQEIRDLLESPYLLLQEH
jgi:pyruvate dehydrogenase E2 component (dihydrolipoamide acetyltransferase)